MMLVQGRRKVRVKKGTEDLNSEELSWRICERLSSPLYLSLTHTHTYFLGTKCQLDLISQMLSGIVGNEMVLWLKIPNRTSMVSMQLVLNRKHDIQVTTR